MRTFGEFNERLIALCEEFGVRYDGGWGLFEDNDAAGIAIVVDAMERWKPGATVGQPFQPEWTEDEIAAGLAAAEAFSELWPKRRVQLHQWRAALRDDILLVDLSGLADNAEERLRLFPYENISIFPREPRPTVATGRVMT